VKRKYYKYKVLIRAQSTGENFRVNNYSVVTHKTRLANNVNFNGMLILGEGDVTIGNNFHSGVGCIIITSYHNYDKGEAIPYDSTYFTKMLQ
jgi:hypothetical protein